MTHPPAEGGRFEPLCFTKGLLWEGDRAYFCSNMTQAFFFFKQENVLSTPPRQKWTQQSIKSNSKLQLWKHARLSSRFVKLDFIDMSRHLARGWCRGRSPIRRILTQRSWPSSCGPRGAGEVAPSRSCTACAGASQTISTAAHGTGSTNAVALLLRSSKDAHVVCG